MKLLCRLFGHKVNPDSLNAKRLFAHCSHCDIALKVSYDPFNGDTIVNGDYGDQKTFIWCDCGNELISSGSYHYHVDGIDTFYCSNCSVATLWDFNAPVPLRVGQKVNNE